MASTLTTTAGSPLPLGVASLQKGANFAVFADSPATLTIYAPEGKRIASFPMARTGQVYHLFVEGASPGSLYSFSTDAGGPLLDPYATETNSGTAWTPGRSPYAPLGVIPSSHSYDWEGDAAPNIPKEKLVIYEMHVRGFTRDPSSGVKHPGTYLGAIEKIEHLKSLGINAIEILPLFEFNEGEYAKVNPATGKLLCNYWGYATANFFSPMNRYASSSGDASRELKDLIKALHKNDIEVILDVVYNHTGEGNGSGPQFSFKGLANSTYYILDDKGHYLNFSGCGNTFNCNAPAVRELIISSLRHWVAEYRVDGFRFDLASILARGVDGALLVNPPLIEAITNDPLLRNVKLIAEAWDAVGLYQVGHFYPEGDRWSEWNGSYRDVARRFIKGTHGLKGEFATRLCGSQDLYYQQSPSASVNFITCHDGFTLADLVAYNHKHNQENGENNQDGSSWNDSWNCGIEGPTDDPDVLALRARQMRNFHVALMVSQGIPMLHMGDEYGHTKRGNNNTWCQDNALNWFQWDLLDAGNHFHTFYKFLIAFRNAHPQFHRSGFLTDKEIQWHGTSPFQPSWEQQNSFIALTLLHDESHLYIAFNASDKAASAVLPPPRENSQWKVVVNTGEIPPRDVVAGEKDAPSPFAMKEYSCLILKS